MSLTLLLVVAACSPALTATPAAVTVAPVAVTAPAAPPTLQATLAVTTVPPAESPTRAVTASSTLQSTGTEPTAVPPPTATQLALGVISYEGSVTLNTYPYRDFLREQVDPATNISYLAFDRQAYDAASPKPVPQTYRTIVLENEYLQLVLLPELGGRLYQARNKRTGQNIFYNNPVIKPSPWGMSDQGGWLAAGGMEWAFPTREHGYEWNLPWDAQVTSDRFGMSVTMTDSTADDRPRVSVRVTLPSGGDYFTVEPTIENPTAVPRRVQFWVNAALNPGAAGVVPPQTEFIFPGDEVWVHSTGNEWIAPQFVPAEDATAPAEPITLSDVNGRDMRRYENWDNYLGVFAVESGAGELAQNFVGAYNHAADFGVARVFSPAAAPGVKLFGFGPEFCCVDAYTDDGSGYFELWGGIPRTFFAGDDVTLAPGEARTWTEYWLPLPGTGGLSAASSDAALYRAVKGDSLDVTAFSAVARDVVIVVKYKDTVLKRRAYSFRPGDVLVDRLSLEELGLQNIRTEDVQLEMQDANGTVIVVTR